MRISLSPGDRSPFSGNPLFSIDVGHTFVSFSTNHNGSESNLTFGFYSSEEVDLDNPVVPMAIDDDGNHEYSASVTIELSCEDFNQALIVSIAASEQDYNLNEYDCTDYGITVANSVGVGVEDTTSPWVFMGRTHGRSSKPGDLGEDIKNVLKGEINSTGGTAPITNCN